MTLEEAKIRVLNRLAAVLVLAEETPDSMAGNDGWIFKDDDGNSLSAEDVDTMREACRRVRKGIIDEYIYGRRKIPF